VAGRRRDPGVRGQGPAPSGHGCTNDPVAVGSREAPNRIASGSIAIPRLRERRAPVRLPSAGPWSPTRPSQQEGYPLRRWVGTHGTLHGFDLPRGPTVG
jgi:hypothetical protein